MGDDRANAGLGDFAGFPVSGMLLDARERQMRGRKRRNRARHRPRPAAASSARVTRTTETTLTLTPAPTAAAAGSSTGAPSKATPAAVSQRAPTRPSTPAQARPPKSAPAFAAVPTTATVHTESEKALQSSEAAEAPKVAVPEAKPATATAVKMPGAGRNPARTIEATAGESATAASRPKPRRTPKSAQPPAEVAREEGVAVAPPLRSRRRRSAAREEPTSGRKFPTLARVAAATARELEAEQLDTADDVAAAGMAAEAKAETRVRPAAKSKDNAAVASTPPQFPATRAAPATVALRRSPATKRLADTQRLALPDDQADEMPAAAPPSASASVSARPRPLPEPDLIVPVASIQVALATAAALVGAALLIASQDSAFWALALTVIAGGGGSLGYLLAQRRHSLRAAGYALLLAQLGMLAWLLAIVGPRASVLALTAIVALLTLRMSGRVAALTAIAGALAIYAVASALALAGLLSPAIDASAGMLALLDGVLAGLGLLGTLAGALDLQARKARAEAAARARRYELRMRRARVAELRQQVEDDADELVRALSEALRGTGITAPQVRGLLSPLAEGVVSAAERLATLQQDREDRIRIEAALRAVTREVERAWLGLPWVWPQASGTALDELVALLRAPRPTNTNARTPWVGETLTPVPLPTLDTAPVPRISASSASASVPDLSRVRPRAPVLPWNEWDEWRGWDPSQVRDGT